MDTLIERKPGINRKRLYWVGGVMLGLAAVSYTHLTLPTNSRV